MTGQTIPPKRRRGGQPGNTNALKHGLFSRRINPTDLYHLGVHPGYASDQQIAQLRIYIKDLFDHAMQVDDLSENLVLLDHIAVAAGILARFLHKRAKLLVSHPDPDLRRLIALALVRQMRKEKDPPADAPSPAPPQPDSDSN